MIPMYKIRYGYKSRRSEHPRDARETYTLPGLFTAEQAKEELEILRNTDEPLFFAYSDHVFDDYDDEFDAEGNPLKTPENSLP